MKSKKVLLLIGMLSLGFIVEAGILVHSCSTSKKTTSLSDDSMERPPKALSDEIFDEMTARREIRELRREVASLKMKMQIMDNKTIGANEGKDHGLAANADNSDNSMFTQDEAVMERFEREPVDEVWKAEVHKRIQAFLGHESLRNSHIDNFECRSTLCKMNVVHQTQADQDVFLGLMETDSPQFQEVGITPYGNEADGYGSNCYIVRKGAPILSAGQGRTSLVDEIQNKLRNGQVIPQP